MPQFYVERKKMRAAVDELKGAHTDLMHELNANILADDVAAHIMPREEKIPVEITLEDGTVVTLVCSPSPCPVFEKPLTRWACSFRIESSSRAGLGACSAGATIFYTQCTTRLRECHENTTWRRHSCD